MEGNAVHAEPSDNRAEKLSELDVAIKQSRAQTQQLQ